MKAIQRLLQDPAAYLESAGKQDKEGLMQALKEEGAGTALRVCLWRDRLYTL